MPVFTGLQPHGLNLEPDIKQRFVPYTAEKLLSRSRGSADRKWAAWVSVVRVKKFFKPGEPRQYRFELITTHPDTPPNRAHHCSIWARNSNYTGPLHLAPAIKISCDCLRWVYHYEYAAWYRGVSDLLYCNGEFPVITNPGLRVNGCKHCIQALNSLIVNKL